MGWLFVLVFALAILFFYGLVLLIFRRGRRKRGAKIAMTSMFGAVVALVVIALSGANQIAVGEGWSSRSEKFAARREDIYDPEVWRAMLAERVAADAQRVKDREMREEAQRQAKAEAEAKAEADRRRAGFHCLSQWDGSHTEFKWAVEKAMREPDSFEHIETRIAPVDSKGWHAVFMQYRARNGFGGMNIGQAVGRVANDDCRFEIVKIE